jgi:hypothetical protein
MARRIRWTKQDPDQTVVTAEVINLIPGSCLGPCDIEPGTVLEIARVVRTPLGLSYRIKGTKRWVQENDVKVELGADQIFDYTRTRPEEMMPESWKPTKETKKVSKKKKVSIKSRIRFVTNNNNPGLGRKLKGALGMNKLALRRALTGLEPDDRLTVTFLGARADRSGEFTVVRTKKGRGKGGSQLVELRTADGEVFTTGTPESELVLHVITPDGTLHGHETAADVPPSFETDAGRAATLKETFKGLIDHCVPMPKEAHRAGGRNVAAENDTRSRFTPEGNVSLTVQSTHEPFNGTFTLRMIELKRGRYGKVLLTVANASGQSLVLDSFQHSGIITSFEVTTN